MRSALAMVTFGLLLVTDAAGGDKKEKETIQGVWKVISVERLGERIPEADVKDFGFTFGPEGDKYRWAAGKFSEEGKYKVGLEGKLKTIDLDIQTGEDKGKLQLGIYQLDGDMLKICFAKAGGKDRPTEFATKKDSRGFLLVTLKRQEKK